MPRDTVPTFNKLLETARGIEETLHEYAASSETGENRNAHAQGKKGKLRCTFCKNPGHTADVCRKKKRTEGTLSSTVKDVSEGQTQAPSPSQPKFSCYGCGAPGVYRSNCSTCKKSPSPVKKENVGFCALDAHEETHSRPTVFLEVEGIMGTAFMDTCAKMSVASYSLYQALLKNGCKFDEKTVDLTLADGIKREQVVLVCKAMVSLNGRKIATRFIVLQEARDNRTLLGVDFLQNAGVMINMPQYTWSFIDEPDLQYELYPEEFTIFESTVIKEMMILPSPLSEMTVTDREDATSISDAIPTPPSTPPPVVMAAGQAATPPRDQHADTDYKLALIDLTSTPPSKKKPRLFDGYSPSFTDFMMRDAQINVHRGNAELSPESNSLFDANNWDVRLNSIDVVIHITPDQDKLINQLLEKNTDVFNTKREPTKLIEHTIKTVDDKPISVPPYRLSPPRKEALQREIKAMLADGIIQHSASPWAAPVVLVPKANGSLRVCVDYRRLNAITVPDPYPIPRIDDLLHEAKPTPYMSLLDLKAGYWQIGVRNEDQDKTAFITPFGVYKFTRMPFGLRNAPATFQRLIDRMRVGLPDVKLLAYLDDLAIFSQTFEQHLEDLQRVFTQLKEFGLTANRGKCHFCCSTIKYLGHYITPNGLQVDPEKTAAIAKLPVPSNLKHLVAFLQTCSWYRRFIENFAKIAEPLTRLTKKNVSWEWTEEQQNAYNELKYRLTSAPILRQADETEPYVIKSDASSYAIGAVLVQGEGEDEHPVEFASRLLTSAERNYTTTEREALAVVFAVSKFRGYIEGLPVTVITDHQALKWLMSLKSPTGRLARWALQLQAFDITIKYAPGKTNVVADFLSRPPCNNETVGACGICTVTIDMPIRSPAEIRGEQLKDERLQQIVKDLESLNNDEKSVYWSNKGYLMNNGLLYRHSPHSDSEEAQLAVPEHEWANILSTYHDSPLAGHYGPDKTYRRISTRYYWTGMRKYIESYTKNCLECQRYKSSNQKPAGLLQTTVMNQRFEVISFDLFGPLPTSLDGKTWIFIVEDVATRWVELFALQQATAENCAMTLINELFLRFGFPRRMISDNGPQFVSAVMQQVAFTMNIKHAFTPVYHPETNPVERKNRDLKPQLAILVKDKHREWPEHLPSIRFAMNTASSLSTGSTPAYLTFGRELRTPDDTSHDLRKILQSENFVPEITPKLMQLASTLQQAREIQEHGEERRKKYVDKQRREDPGYHPGELVLATTHTLSNASRGVSNKFAPRRDGPYVVKKRHGPSSYEIADPQKPDVVIGVYHSSALVPYVGESSLLPAPVQPLRKRGRPRKQTLEHGSGTEQAGKRGKPKDTPPLAGSSSGRLQIQRGRL